MWVSYVTGTPKMSQIGPLYMELHYPYIMKKVSLERYYFVLYDGAHTFKMPKMLLNPFCDETLLEPQLAHARHLGYHTSIMRHNNLYSGTSL